LESLLAVYWKYSTFFDVFCAPNEYTFYYSYSVLFCSVLFFFICVLFVLSFCSHVQKLARDARPQLVHEAPNRVAIMQPVPNEARPLRNRANTNPQPQQRIAEPVVQPAAGPLGENARFPNDAFVSAAFDGVVFHGKGHKHCARIMKVDFSDGRRRHYDLRGAKRSLRQVIRFEYFLSDLFLFCVSFREEYNEDVARQRRPDEHCLICLGKNLFEFQIRD
jgi:hypothetical protein